MKIWKELKHLEERVREEPSPTTFVDLGQVYINLECYDKAVRVAEDGRALFPRSVELGKLLDCARRGLGKQRVAELKADMLAAFDEEQLDEEHFKPTGTLVILGLWLTMVVLLWASVYIILLSRGVTL